MATIKLTRDNFEEVVSSDATVFVDFWASWCGPCRMLAPVFESASEQHPDVVFVKVDTETEQELAQAFGIMSIPRRWCSVIRSSWTDSPVRSRSHRSTIHRADRCVEMDDVHHKIAEQAAVSA